MTPVCWLVAIVAAAVPVEATSLSGTQVTGTLTRLTPQELTLQPETGPAQVLPTADLLEVRLTTEGSPAGSGETPPLAARVALVDGSHLQLTEFATTAKEITGKHALLGEVKLPLLAVCSLRFTPPHAKFDPLWNQLLEKGAKGDMIVLQKNEVLDHLDGVVGQLDQATIKFLLDGDDISVKREKAFGVIYSRKPSSAKLAAKVMLGNGDALAVKAVTSDGEAWQLDGVGGGSWSLPASAVSLIDFSLGKVVYLSTLEPRAVRYTPFIQFQNEADFYWKVRRDRNLEGKPLRLGQKTYARGLAIHSKTELRYRLGGEFRRLQAMLGIDDEITNTNWGAASLRILGDRKELYAGEFRPRQPPVPIDLDVAEVVELEIIVDFGPDKSDISDRVHFADARLVK